MLIHNINKIDTKVFVDGVETTAYTITQGSDSTIKAISSDMATSQKLILLFYKMLTTVLTVLQLIITGGTWTGSDSLRVTTFNNPNLEKKLQHKHL